MLREQHLDFQCLLGQIINEDPLSETMTAEQIKRHLSENKTDQEKAVEKAAAEETTAAEEEDEKFQETNISKDSAND